MHINANNRQLMRRKCIPSGEWSHKACFAGPVTVKAYSNDAINLTRG